MRKGRCVGRKRRNRGGKRNKVRKEDVWEGREEIGRGKEDGGKRQKRKKDDIKSGRRKRTGLRGKRKKDSS